MMMLGTKINHEEHEEHEGKRDFAKRMQSSRRAGRQDTLLTRFSSWPSCSSWLIAFSTMICSKPGVNDG
jgi:hypothetical protein